MKVALLTVHCSTNYGASLQAYALKRYLEERGHTVSIINYRHPGFLYALDYSKKLSLSFSSRIKIVLFKDMCRQRYEAFQRFEKQYLGVGEVELNRVDEIDGVDIYLVGSDQVWNPSHVSFDESFYFSGIRNGVKVSYAASLGKEVFTEQEKSYLKSVTENMDSISVRELQSVKTLKALGYKGEVSVNIDPVFLIDKSKWRELEKPVVLPIKEYVLVYLLGENVLDKKTARYLKRGVNNVVCIQADLRRKYGRINLYDVSPQEFLFLIDNAEYVITNSFHGLAFSIIFRKKVLALHSKSLNMRLENLMAILGMERMQIKSIEEIKERGSLQEKSEKWQDIEEIIKSETKKSELYFLSTGL